MLQYFEQNNFYRQVDVVKRPVAPGLTRYNTYSDLSAPNA